jgi:hypothetical protein
VRALRKKRRTFDKTASLAPARRAWLVLTLCASLTAPAAAQGDESAPRLRAEHRAVVREWLKARREGAAWRPATTRDWDLGADLSSLRVTKGKRDYHPFYAVGDFNRDGRGDFAVMLFRKRPKQFAVAVFNGPFTRGRNRTPAFYDGRVAEGDAIHVIDGRLLIGPFESDNCYILMPRVRRYVAEPCLEG